MRVLSRYRSAIETRRFTSDALVRSDHVTAILLQNAAGTIAPIRHRSNRVGATAAGFRRGLEEIIAGVQRASRESLSTIDR